MPALCRLIHNPAWSAETNGYRRSRLTFTYLLVRRPRRLLLPLPLCVDVRRVTRSSLHSSAIKGRPAVATCARVILFSRRRAIVLCVVSDGPFALPSYGCHSRRAVQVRARDTSQVSSPSGARTYIVIVSPRCIVSAVILVAPSSSSRPALRVHLASVSSQQHFNPGESGHIYIYIHVIYTLMLN